jgi:hypothetical protein
MIVAISTIKMIIHPDEGLIEKVMNNGTVRKGPGTRTSHGYRQTRVEGVLIFVHRLIWQHVNGAIPEGLEIDHINGVRHDNRITNLRLATSSQNHQNQRHSKSKSGVKGVSWDNTYGKWRATIEHNRMHFNLGRFTTIEDARIAYAGAAAILHTHNPHAAP